MGTLFPDTHPDAERPRIEGLRQMLSLRKMELMAGMCASAETFTLAGLRRRLADLIPGPELLARPDGPLPWKGQRCTTNRSWSPPVTGLLTRALPEAHEPNDQP